MTMKIYLVLTMFTLARCLVSSHFFVLSRPQLLRNLKTLSIHDNEVDGRIPSEVGRMTALEYLFVGTLFRISILVRFYICIHLMQFIYVFVVQALIS